MSTSGDSSSESGERQGKRTLGRSRVPAAKKPRSSGDDFESFRVFHIQVAKLESKDAEYAKKLEDLHAQRAALVQDMSRLTKICKAQEANLKKVYLSLVGQRDGYYGRLGIFPSDPKPETAALKPTPAVTDPVVPETVVPKVTLPETVVPKIVVPAETAPETAKPVVTETAKPVVPEIADLKPFVPEAAVPKSSVPADIKSVVPKIAVLAPFVPELLLNGMSPKLLSPALEYSSAPQSPSAESSVFANMCFVPAALDDVHGELVDYGESEYLDLQQTLSH